MAGKFNWFTDDEASWEWENREEAVSSISTKSGSRFNFLPKKGFILFLILFITLLLGMRQIVLRAQETNEQITADVLAAQDFMLQAVLAGDPERFNLVLSDKDFQWQHLQRVSLRRDLLFDRGPFNLWFHDEAVRQMLAGNELSAQLVLAPDLRSAELTPSLPYLTQTTAGALEPLWLRRTMHFEYDGGQWRHVPPAVEDWGPMESYRGQMVVVDYPLKDAEMSHYLAAALDEKFLALCAAEPTIECPAAPAIDITFSTDPEALLSLSRPVQGSRFWLYRAHLNSQDKFEISVPAPSLLGIPESAEGRQVLLKGYAGWLITSFLTRKSPGLSFEEIAQRLADLDLQLPPPFGYEPLQGQSELPLPAEKAVLSCYDHDQLTRSWAYDFSQNQWALLDMENCTSCGGFAAPVAEFTSADGRFTISPAVDSSSLLLTHSTGDFIEKIDDACDPVWIDEKTFAFLAKAAEPVTSWDRPNIAAEPEVIIARLSGAPGSYQVNLERRITQQELLSAVPENRIIGTLQLDAILPQIGAPGYLFILTSNGLHEQFLFQAPLDGRAAELITGWVDNGSVTNSFQATQNGRFLTVMRYNSRNSYLTLIDLTTGNREIMELAGDPLARFAWSADEQWLLVANDRLLRLFSPRNNIDFRIKHTHGGCTAINWAG